MKVNKPVTRLALDNILFLSDFSEPSDEALPFAVAVAREYNATLHALHVLMPEAYACTTPESTAAVMEAQEECAQASMERLDVR